MTTFRKMQPADRASLVQLWTDTFGQSTEYAERMLCRLPAAGVFVAEEAGEPVAMLAAVPVNQEEHRGVWLYGLAVQKPLRGKGIGTGLLDYTLEQIKLQNYVFAVIKPAQEITFSLFEKHGFATTFYSRKLERVIHRNIWSQAEFDSCPAKKLCELRKMYAPSAVLYDSTAMIEVLTELYSRGITVVSSDEGYGLYYRNGETLAFIELMADGDRAAESLMEAAREKEVVVENAVISIGAKQNLFLGEGKRVPYGMIHFFDTPFDLTDSDLSLLIGQ